MIRDILERAYKNHIRVRVFYGDANGYDFGEFHDTIGYIGRSSGRQPVYILKRNRNSSGGPALLEDNIIRITIDKKDVYKSSNYKPILTSCMPRQDGKINVYRTDRGKLEHIYVAENEEESERVQEYLDGRKNRI